MRETTSAIVDLRNLRHNIREYKSILAESTQIIAVIKADGYGHGVLPVYNAAVQEGVKHFAVSKVKEGAELREAGVKEEILVLGGTLPFEMEPALEHSLVPAIYSIDQLIALSEAAKKRDVRAKFHLKLNTGMNRLGVRRGDNLEEFLNALDQTENVYFSGIFSHFAVSDVDPVFTKEQYREFIQAMRQIEGHEYMPKTHISNSAAIATYDSFDLDFVRLGIGMYGLNPQDTAVLDLKPVMSLRAQIVQLNDIKAGETVSYGRTFTAASDTKIAVLPIGYADGYPRILGNKAHALVHGIRCNVVGTVCMDHIMLDVSKVPQVECGDEAILIGKQGGDEITAKELADLAGTIHYEIATGIQKRVAREYIE
ncbi:MAG: alanine racemase [Clostridia bacterium]|nr:alanine racemase [Clostridia bacterium]